MAYEIVSQKCNKRFTKLEIYGNTNALKEKYFYVACNGDILYALTYTHKVWQWRGINHCVISNGTFELAVQIDNALTYGWRVFMFNDVWEFINSDLKKELKGE